MMDQTNPLNESILKQLVLDWKMLNHSLFQGQLKQPQIQLNQQAQFLGLWEQQQRRLKLQEQLVQTQPWLVVLEVLKHEMAHQYISEALKITDEAPHGPSFQRVCLDRNIDYHAYLKLEESYITQPEQDQQSKHDQKTQYQLLDKVRKLLALAQSDNINEAEQAALRAQALIAKHQLDQLQQQAFKAVEFRQLSEPRNKHFLYEYAICKLLSDYFFVDIIWIPNCFNQKTQKIGTVAEMIGSYENLEVAEFVYHFLINNVERLWQQHKKTKKQAGVKNMLSFKYGVIKGFESQLEKQKNNQIQEMGLVYLKDPNIREYLEKRHQVVRKKSHSWTPTASYHDGKTEGEQLKLNQGLSQEKQSPSSQAPKLLT